MTAVQNLKTIVTIIEDAIYKPNMYEKSNASFVLLTAHRKGRVFRECDHVYEKLFGYDNMDTTTNGCRKFESEPRKGEKVAGVYCVCDTELCNHGWVPDDPDTQEGWTTQGTTTTTTAASAGGGGGGVAVPGGGGGGVAVPGGGGGGVAVPGGGGGGINVPGGGGGGIAVNCLIHDYIYVKKM